MIKTSNPSFPYLTLTFFMICLLLRILDEVIQVTVHLFSTWNQAVKSCREKVQENQVFIKLFFNQIYPHGQKIHTRKPKAYSKKFFFLSGFSFKTIHKPQDRRGRGIYCIILYASRWDISVTLCAIRLLTFQWQKERFLVFSFIGPGLVSISPFWRKSTCKK